MAARVILAALAMQISTGCFRDRWEISTRCRRDPFQVLVEELAPDRGDAERVAPLVLLPGRPTGDGGPARIVGIGKSPKVPLANHHWESAGQNRIALYVFHSLSGTRRENWARLTGLELTGALQPAPLQKANRLPGGSRCLQNCKVRYRAEKHSCHPRGQAGTLPYACPWVSW